ncbi:MAG: rod shape-determining protein MreC [Bacteroidales bacterium]|nr:rod shape-determining protein MreC [Bacteroidales bacterium]
MRKSNIIYHIINAAIFILLEIAALSMLSHNGPLQGVWISKGIQAVMSTVWGGAQYIGDYFSLRKHNDALAMENYELSMRLRKFEAAAAENRTDSLPLHEDVAGRYRFIHAEISKISNNTQHNYMIIGKGYEAGVTEGSGVITDKGAVGVVDAVSRNYAYARSFKNHEMNISARLDRSEAVGPLSWDGRSSDGAILKEIPHHVDFQPGDTVFTSGYSSIFPPDIPLGTTGKAKIVNGATYEIEVKLFEDFGALRYVTIVENLDKDEIKDLEDSQR